MIIDGHDIPHMVTGIGLFPVQVSRDTVADNVIFKARHIAQILERLGVTLTDDPCIFVSIKDPDHLPGIAVATSVGRGCSTVIVLHQRADFILVCQQLFIVRQIFVFFHDFAGIGRCSGGSRGLVCLQLVVGQGILIRVEAVLAVLGTDAEIKGKTGLAAAGDGER